MSLPVSTADSAPPGTPVPSPCVNLCRMDPARGLCSGCWRSLDEIASWSHLSDTARREVWRLIAERKAAPGTE